MERICFPSEGPRNRLRDGLKGAQQQLAGGSFIWIVACYPACRTTRSVTVVSSGLFRLLRLLRSRTPGYSGREDRTPRHEMEHVVFRIFPTSAAAVAKVELPEILRTQTRKLDAHSDPAYQEWFKAK
ncbi:hypothetical protein AVEN_73643-1 [Araneus ventricosus]|uniref:Uncharacterized protein n=1 Tax=Araneus ventricosus TaxID=182803 RepID=A0A4Y2Q8D9_ARAVE|nr:hypothetical protein AVEN_73643-1 [Araneus ventricosus]